MGLKEKIESILERMKEIEPLSSKWVRLEDRFLDLILLVRSQRLRFEYLGKYAQMGGGDPVQVRDFLHFIIGSLREAGYSDMEFNNLDSELQSQERQEGFIYAYN